VNDWYFQDVELPIPNLYTVSIIINNHNTILTYPYIYLQCMYIYNSDISSTKSVTWDPLQQQPIPASNVPEPIPSEKVSSAGIMIHHDPHFMVEIQKEARNHQLLLLAVAVVRLLILLIQTDTQLPISQLPWLESLGLVSMDGKTLRKNLSSKIAILCIAYMLYVYIYILCTIWCIYGIYIYMVYIWYIYGIYGIYISGIYGVYHMYIYIYVHMVYRQGK
jgi:hypothetical protein